MLNIPKVKGKPQHFLVQWNYSRFKVLNRKYKVNYGQRKIRPYQKNWLIQGIGLKNERKHGLVQGKYKNSKELKWRVITKNIE